MTMGGWKDIRLELTGSAYEHAGSVAVPDEWSVVMSSDSRVVAVPAGLERFEGDLFAPNLVATLAEREPGFDGPSVEGRRVLHSAAIDALGVERVVSITVDMVRGDEIHQLECLLRRDGLVLSIVGSALGHQWSAVAPVFDAAVCDSVLVAGGES